MNDAIYKSDNLTFLKVEYESRNVPPMELYKFSWDLSKWSLFIKNSSKHVNFKTAFANNQTMKRFLTILGEEAKGMVQFIEQGGIFYPAVLECLKQEKKQNPTIVSYLKLKNCSISHSYNQKISQQLNVFSSSYPIFDGITFSNQIYR